MMNPETTAPNQPLPGGFTFGNFNNNQQGVSTVPDAKTLFLRKHARQWRKADPQNNSEAFKAALDDYTKYFKDLRDRRNVHSSRFTYGDPQRRATDEDIDDMLCRALDVFAILRKYPTIQNDANFTHHMWNKFVHWRNVLNVGDHSVVDRPDLLQDAANFKMYMNEQLIEKTAKYKFSDQDRRFFRDDVIPAIDVFLETRTAKTYYAYMLLRERVEKLIESKVGFFERIRRRKKTTTVAAAEDQLVKRPVAGRPNMSDKEIVDDMSMFPARAKTIVFVNGDGTAVDQAIKDALSAAADYDAVRNEPISTNKVDFIDKYRTATHALENMGEAGMIRDMTRQEVEMLNAYTSYVNSWGARNMRSTEEIAEDNAFLKRFKTLPIIEPLLNELQRRYEAVQRQMVNSYPNYFDV